MHYGAIYDKAVPADIILETEQGTYLGTFDRSKVDRRQPIEEQPIWSIRFLRVTPEAGDGTRTDNLYPEGSKEQCFVFAQYSSYTYNYAL